MRRQLASPLVLGLLLAALFVRAVVPQGYMVESTGPGSLAIVACHSAPAAQVHHDMGGHNKDNGKLDLEQHPCAYAGIALALSLPEPHTLPLPAAARNAFLHREAPFALRHSARQLPPARAPPAIA